jgi:hypothetical protein
MTDRPTLTGELLDQVLDIHRVYDWVLLKPNGGHGVISDSGNCLFANYLNDTLGAMLDARVNAQVSHFDVNISATRLLPGASGVVIRSHPLPAYATAIIKAVDHGATKWISRDRALDLLEWQRNLVNDQAVLASAVVDRIDGILFEEVEPTAVPLAAEEEACKA